MTADKEKPVSRAGNALHALESMILTGELQPRERLVVNALAERLGVSAYAIRTALQALEANGLVKMESNRGAVVSDLGADEIKEIFEVRVGLEKMANRMAAAHVTPDDITRLEEIEARLEAAYAQSELSEVIASNAMFHNYVAEMSRNQTLIKMILELKKRCHIFNTTAWSSPNVVAILFEEHRQYIRALGEKDLALLDELPERHFVHSKALFLQHLDAKKANFSPPPAL
jgi:DNA-binding GntR family transcriptional regulator